MDSIRQAVLRELAETVSSSVELDDLRILKGEESIRSAEEYTVSGVEMKTYSGRNKVTLSLGLTNRKKEAKSLVVEAVYDVLVDVYVTSKALKAGSLLGESDYHALKQKSSRLPAGAITVRKDLEGRMLKATVGQGIVIKSDYLAARAGVKKGTKVTVVVETDNILVSTQGELRRDAVVGGNARVLCDSSKKEVNGILVNPETVRVKI
jgi:flagella basal body P-ring formation protein FlgA